MCVWTAPHMERLPFSSRLTPFYGGRAAPHLVRDGLLGATALGLVDPPRTSSATTETRLAQLAFGACGRRHLEVEKAMLGGKTAPLNGLFIGCLNSAASQVFGEVQMYLVQKYVSKRSSENHYGPHFCLRRLLSSQIDLLMF